MAQIRAIQARGLLGSIARGAAAGTVDLIDALVAAYESVGTASFKSGRIYVSSSGNGQSHSFLIPSQFTASFSTERIAEQYQEFIEIYNDSVAAGLITDGTDLSADLAVMLADDRLQTVESRRLDISGIRMPLGISGSL